MIRVFYLVYTVMPSNEPGPSDMYNYLVTALISQVPGPNPALVNQSFDPSLFHDHDGRKCFLVELG
jgi:beta-xylosidase